MSTPNQPQDPYQPQDPNQPGQTPSYGETPSYGQTPQYGQTPDYGQTPQYGAPDPSAGYPSYPSAQPYAQTPMYGYPKNNLGVWSLVLGIVGLLVCGLVAGIPALILGLNSRKAVARGEANNGGLGTTGIVLGSLSIAWSVIYGLLILTGNFTFFTDSSSF